jgi:hypothetical protein
MPNGKAPGHDLASEVTNQRLKLTRERTSPTRPPNDAAATPAE